MGDRTATATGETPFAASFAGGAGSPQESPRSRRAAREGVRGGAREVTHPHGTIPTGARRRPEATRELYAVEMVHPSTR
jgi:hypothetical protein